MRSLDAKTYFASRSITTASGCIEWTGPLKGEGYGQSPARFGGGRYAHRAIYELERGTIPRGMCVCHKCDNMKCINPEHLFIGTHQDNIKDKISKNRQSGGSMPNERNPHCRISNSQIIEMRRARSRGDAMKNISAEFGVDLAHCYRIINNQSRYLAEAK